jgi:hypothetical protein
MYRSLDPQKTIATLKTLSMRIEERFPGASLNKVCLELAAVAEETTGRIAWLEKRHAGIRFAILAVIGIAIVLGVMLYRHVKIHTDGFSIEELEAATNAIVLLGAALFFLFSLEARLKRARVLKAVHELRSISHVIDMHQLTKDPSQVIEGAGPRTQSSPKRTLSAFELTRYLDYCSEMLSLVGKLAALYVQSTNDSVVLQAVNDIETLTNGISRKIWQKIMILDNDLTIAARNPPPSGNVAADTKMPSPTSPRTTPDAQPNGTTRRPLTEPANQSNAANEFTTPSQS